MTTYVKLVKGATKIKMAPPKQKYIDPILMGSTDPRDFHEIIRALYSRISDSAWTVVYKSLIVTHLLIREGEKDITLDYLSNNLDFFNLNGINTSKFSSGDVRALERYNQYLLVRAKEFKNFRIDFIRASITSIINSASKLDLLDYVDSLEIQINSLIKNKYSQLDLNNDLLMYAFKLLIQDLLQLYNSLNEGIITLLESFFELNHRDAERTLELYKTFVDLTEIVVKYLKVGKSVGLRIPVIKHITTKLIRSLEDHLKEEQNNPPNNKESTIYSATTTSPNGEKSLAQQKLDQVREQKRVLQEQLRNQTVLMSPTLPQPGNTPNLTSTVNDTNPFGQAKDTFTFENPATTTPASQTATSNPFLTSTAPVTANTTGIAYAPVQIAGTNATGLFTATPQTTASPSTTPNPFNLQPTAVAAPVAPILTGNPFQDAQNQLQAQQNAQLQAQQNAQAQAQAQLQAHQVQTQAQFQAQAQAQAQARAQAEAQARAQAEAQARAQAEAQARAQAEAQARAQAEAQAEAAAQAQAQAQAQLQAQQQAAAQAQLQAQQAQAQLQLAQQNAAAAAANVAAAQYQPQLNYSSTGTLQTTPQYPQATIQLPPQGQQLQGQPQQFSLQTTQTQQFASPQTHQFASPQTQQFASPQTQQFTSPQTQQFTQPPLQTQPPQQNAFYNPQGTNLIDI
ncbi:hypothetical protein TBLA_0B05770 [Henningerozyma blattae CBS 6284]|uniref:ENTH domain-containing protein n=1 Tax=Henningerozyma blattae (strain ATCC 34711 / CBS 6284 / DSM 70876 / NBRC 10599 / NRRL Y-10934 / UCD 77-7) TaxID=1071380 RepID=I2GZ52_HENB6|nr:hypothetical protein TBLA_0B05770 [Tetrapisispora blattae CBS 6284]CCH59404.1 hypothetical protein TBLA_0B05770 [Tetrapisispora blattae CBS 6284]